MAEKTKRKDPDVAEEEDLSVTPEKDPEVHKSGPPKTMKEQIQEHERANAGWTTHFSPWFRESDESGQLYGSKEALLMGIFNAVKASHEASHPDQESVEHSWVKSKLDEYQLSSFDADVRSFVAEQFDLEGVKVKGRE